MRQFCEDVQEQEEKRLKKEFDADYQSKVKYEEEIRSLAGHIKLPIAKNSKTIFGSFTFAYLETHDLVKLLKVGKGMRQDLLS